jgi:hypothetical protein
MFIVLMEYQAETRSEIEQDVSNTVARLTHISCNVWLAALDVIGSLVQYRESGLEMSDYGSDRPYSRNSIEIRAGCRKNCGTSWG